MDASRLVRGGPRQVWTPSGHPQAGVGALMRKEDYMIPPPRSYPPPPLKQNRQTNSSFVHISPTRVVTSHI